MIYPPLSEGGLNNEALQEAINALGGNTLYTPLKMNKEYTPIKWETLFDIVEFTQDFAKNFYGDSEDDLIDAGITYKII